MPHLSGNLTLAEFVNSRPWPARVTVDDVVRIANQLDVVLKDGRICNTGAYNGELHRLSFAVESDARRRRRAAGIPMTREGDERASRLPSAAYMEACAPGADELAAPAPTVTDLTDPAANARAALAVARTRTEPNLRDDELEALLWAIRNVHHKSLTQAAAIGRFGPGTGYGCLSSAANEVERALGARIRLREAA